MEKKILETWEQKWVRVALRFTREESGLEGRRLCPSRGSTRSSPKVRPRTERRREVARKRRRGYERCPGNVGAGPGLRHCVFGCRQRKDERTNIHPGPKDRRVGVFRFGNPGGRRLSPCFPKKERIKTLDSPSRVRHLV